MIETLDEFKSCIFIYMARTKVLKPPPNKMVLKMIPLSMMADPEKFGMRMAIPMIAGNSVVLDKSRTMKRKTEAEKKRHKLTRKMGKAPPGFQYKA